MNEKLTAKDWCIPGGNLIYCPRLCNMLESLSSDRGTCCGKRIPMSIIIEAGLEPRMCGTASGWTLFYIAGISSKADEIAAIQAISETAILNGRMCRECGGTEIEIEDYVNPCREAACRHNGPSYHLGCGSQERIRCRGCGTLLLDSADEEIAAAEWVDIKWGGDTYSVPVD